MGLCVSLDLCGDYFRGVVEPLNGVEVNLSLEEFMKILVKIEKNEEFISNPSLLLHLAILTYLDDVSIVTPANGRA